MNIFVSTWEPFIVSFIVSLFVCIVLVLTQPLHQRFTADSNEGVQKVHTHTTSRVGGLALFFGSLFGWYVAPSNFFGGMFWTSLVASVPAFFFGFLEDITKRVSVRTRLLPYWAYGKKPHTAIVHVYGAYFGFEILASLIGLGMD